MNFAIINFACIVYWKKQMNDKTYLELWLVAAMWLCKSAIETKFTKQFKHWKFFTGNESLCFLFTCKVRLIFPGNIDVHWSQLNLSAIWCFSFLWVLRTFSESNIFIQTEHMYFSEENFTEWLSLMCTFKYSSQLNFFSQWLQENFLLSTWWAFLVW